MKISGESAEIVVIGAGVIGCSIAAELTRRGHDVLVVDKGPAAGAGSTSSSSAIVRFHYSTFDGVLASWESQAMWRRWAELLDAGAGEPLTRFHAVGMVVIDPPGETRTRNVLQLFDKVGVSYELLGEDELASRFPALDLGRYHPPKRPDDEHFWDDAAGRLSAYFTPDAGFVDDPALAAVNLMDAAKRRGGRFRFRAAVAEIARQGDRVAGVVLDDGTRVTAQVVINAAGPFSSKVNGMAGVLDDFATVGTRALRQEVHVAPAPAGFSLGDGGTVVNDSDLGTYFRVHPGGTVLVGGLEPECDPLVWIDDPDDYVDTVTVGAWEAQMFRLARRLPGLGVPSKPTGLAALYDVTPDWVPVYDRTTLDGFYVAIGTSGNQFKNAPLVGPIMATLVEACEGGQDHDLEPVRMHCPHAGMDLNLGHYSRRRELAETTNSVLG